MSIIRELTDREQQLVQKYLDRANSGLRELRRAEEALNDISDLLCEEDGHILDPSEMAIVTKKSLEDEAE